MKTIPKRKNLITTLMLSGIAWIVLRFLHSPGGKQLADKASR
jgi:hypothetical protein